MATYRIEIERLGEPHSDDEKNFKDVFERVKSEILGTGIEDGTYRATMLADGGVQKLEPISYASKEADMFHAVTMSRLLHLPRTLWM